MPMPREFERARGGCGPTDVPVGKCARAVRSPVSAAPRTCGDPRLAGQCCAGDANPGNGSVVRLTFADSTEAMLTGRRRLSYDGAAEVATAILLTWCGTVRTGRRSPTWSGISGGFRVRFLWFFKAGVSGDMETEMQQAARAVIEYLNAKAGKRFMPVAANLRLVIAPTARGRDGRAAPAGGGRAGGRMAAELAMAKYIRPATLFNASRCAQYIGELKDEHGRALFAGTPLDAISWLDSADA